MISDLISRADPHIYTDFIIALFYRVGLQLGYLRKHRQAGLYLSELVTLALIFAAIKNSVIGSLEQYVSAMD